MSPSAAAGVSLDTREGISVAKQCCTLTRYDRSFQHGGHIPSGDGPGVRKTQDPSLSRRRTFSATNELTFATTRAARGRYAALVPRHVDQAVDAERDERQDDEEDNDDDGDDIVLLHDC